MNITALLSLVLLAPLTVSGQTKRIYLAPDDHTDYIWSAGETAYTGYFTNMLNYYLDQADATSNQPSAFQSRWNCDGSFWLWTYEKYSSAAQFNRLISRLKDGHISAPLVPLVVTWGGIPAEGALRSMYYPGRLERRFHIRFTLAHAMENQTMPFGLGSLWAGAGAKYAWHGVCNCATAISAPPRQNEIYRWTGLDGSSVLMKWYSYVNNDSIGGYAEARFPDTAIDYITAHYTNFTVTGIFGQGWDDAQTKNLNIQTSAINKTTTNRQVIVSNEEDFFRDFEATTNVASYAASFGNEWDLQPASLAEVSAKVKRSVEKLRAAEALQTLVTLQQPGFATNLVAQRDQAFMNMGLYFEHDFTDSSGCCGAERLAWQRRIAGEIELYVTNLFSQATNALAGMIPAAGNPRFYAFNPLGWMRTDYADLPFTNTTAFHVVDVSTGSDVPSQIVTNDGVRYLRIQAANVPSVGYKVFEIQPGAGTTFPPVGSVTGNVISNAAYLLRVHPRGAITNLFDKARSREFVTGSLNDLGASGGASSLVASNAGPVSVSLLTTSTTTIAHTSRITLFQNRVEIQNDIYANPGNTVRQWGYTFNLTNPQVWHEEVGAIIRAALLPTGHYAPQNARYDFLTLNHFADITGTGPVGATLANADAFFFQLGNSSISTLDTNTARLAPLMSGQAPPALGLSNQGGDTYLRQRFALTTHDAYDPVSAMKFALEFQNPLVCATITGGSSYPGTNFSAISVSDTNVLLWAFKPADEGIPFGVIARVWNVATNPATFALNFCQPITRFRQTTHIETDLADVLPTQTIPASAIRTYRINGLPEFTVTAITSADPFALSWIGLGANFFYTVERTDTLTLPQWLPAPPTNQWPTGATNWTDATSTGSVQKFYRVRATGTP